VPDAGLRQAVSAHDATSHLAQLAPVLDPTALMLVGESERQLSARLLGAGIGRLVNLRGTNSFPKP
jgi:hypothetical protein